MMRAMGERVVHAAMFSAVIAASGFLQVAGLVGDMPGRPYAVAFMEQFGHAFLLSLTVVAVIRAAEASDLPGWRRAALQGAALAAGVVAVAAAIARLPFLNVFLLDSGIVEPRALLLRFLWMGFAASTLLSWYYASRERALGSVRALSAASIERHVTLARAEEARLRALRAEVDPAFLDEALVRIHEAYRDGADAGDGAMDQLIDHLTRALRASRSDMPSFAREVPCPTVP